MITEIVVNEEYILECIVTDTNGNPATGLSIDYSIFKSSNDLFISSGSMIDSGNGIYSRNILLSSVGQYRVIYNLPENYPDSMETLMVVEKQSTENTSKMILGLVQHNFRMTNQVYDNNGNMLSAEINIYPSATDATNQTNSINSYYITAVYDASNRLIDYKIIE